MNADSRTVGCTEDSPSKQTSAQPEILLESASSLFGMCLSSY